MRKTHHKKNRFLKEIFISFLLSTSFYCAAQPHSIKKINDLFLHADSLTYPRPDSALAISRDILLLSKELRNEWGLIQYETINGIVFYQKNKLDSALFSLLNVTNKAKTIKVNSYEEARARTYLGFIYTRLSNYEKAKENYEEAAFIFNELGDSLLYCANIINIGIIYGRRGDLPIALEHFLKGREIALKYNTRASKNRLSSALTNIAVVYSLMGDLEKSILFSRESLVLDVNQNDTVAIGVTYNTIGEAFAKNDQWDSALYYHNLCIALAPKNNPRYTSNVMHAYQSIASIYEKMGNLSEAMKMLYSSLIYRTKSEKDEINEVYNLLSKYHLEKDNYDSAIFYQKTNVKSALANGDKQVIQESAEELMNIYASLNQYDSAFYFQSLSKIYSDSVYNETSNKKYNNLQIELATSEKQKEIESLEKQQSIDKANRKILIISIIAILVIAVSVIISLILNAKNKEKKQKIRQMALEAEVKQIEKELQQQTLHMINMNNNVSEVEESIKKLKSKKDISTKDIQKLLSGILVNKSLEKEWQQFDSYFSKMHPSFGSQLLSQHSNLTLQERRLISLIKMNLSNREISSILSIEPRSVIMSRYRLKKKLGLDDSQDLEVYVHTLAEEETKVSMN